MMQKILLKLLKRKIRKYFEKYAPILVVVVGSVGKTSTKNAIATVLSEKYRVRAHDENYNSEFSVPTAIMGVKYPDNPHSVSQWLAVLKAMRRRIKQPKDVDVIVQELGTDHPGDIRSFADYLHPNIAVVTAVSEEHMQYFKTMDAVAQEELTVAAFSDLTIVNRDDVDSRYSQYANTHNISTYGLSDGSEYRLAIEPASPLDGRAGKLLCPEWGEVPVNLQLVGDQSLKVAAAAMSVGAKLGLTSDQVAVGASKIRPVKGRMNVLRGLRDTTIIDDTYNASPRAVEAALKTLYDIEVPQRIAILGSMNELGDMSAQEHERIGKLCDPTKLAWVITIGVDAGRYLAPAAKDNGCQVETFDEPYPAGGFCNKIMETGAVILAKGSQNGVFAEEAVKVILHDNKDYNQLVRQSEAWLDRKQDVFDHAVPDNDDNSVA